MISLHLQNQNGLGSSDLQTETLEIFLALYVVEIP